MSSINPAVKKANIEFVKNLKGNESIGIDNEGRLYIVKEAKILSIAKNIFTKTDPRISQAITEVALDLFENKEFRELESSQKTYQSFFESISKLNILSKDQKASLAFVWYSNKVDQLVTSGIRKEVAEAIATVEMYHDPQVPSEVKEIIKPEPTSGGTSGSYFIKDRNGRKIGIFKPMDEEIYMPNNPRGFRAPLSNTDRRFGPKNGHSQGSSWQKEQAAWLLDKGQNANVPYTTVVTLPFSKNLESKEVVSKKGSLQLFAKGVPVEDLTSSEIEGISKDEVHKVAIFDLKVGNSDRNLGNMLYDRKASQLTPIDHGLILLDSLDWKGMNTISETNCHWLAWPQIKEPLNDSNKKVILDIDIEAETAELRKAGISEGSIREYTLRIIFLKEAVKQGLNLYEIGNLCMQTAGHDNITFLDTVMRQTFFSLAENDAYLDEKKFYQEFEINIQNELKKVA